MSLPSVARRLQERPLRPTASIPGKTSCHFPAARLAGPSSGKTPDGQQTQLADPETHSFLGAGWREIQEIPCPPRFSAMSAASRVPRELSPRFLLGITSSSPCHQDSQDSLLAM